MTTELKTPYMPSSEPHEAPDSALTPSLMRLWAEVQQDDQSAFEQVYRLCSGAVYGLCLRMTADRAAADDCVQSTFLRAWEKRQSFRGEASLASWLHRIAVNMVLGRGRSEGRLRDLIDDYAQTVPLWTESLGAEDALLDRELERAIAALPDRSRQVFVLHALHGYKHSEVGEMMGIKVGTSKAHYHRSRELLKERLGKDNSSESDGAQI